jgi:predicted outer membrane protein
MDRPLAQAIGLGALTAVLTVFVARVQATGAPAPKELAGVVAGDSAATSADSTITVKWLNDANVLALVDAINARQSAAAEIMLSSWHSDTVRALATLLAHDHADLQHSADSLASTLGITPVAPAITPQVTAEFQAQIDSMLGHRGMALDRAYVTTQVASHQLMSDYLDQLHGVASASEVRDWIESAGQRVDADLKAVQMQQRVLAVADSITADSLAKRAAARRRR